MDGREVADSPGLPALLRKGEGQGRSGSAGLGGGGGFQLEGVLAALGVAPYPWPAFCQEVQA